MVKRLAFELDFWANQLFTGYMMMTTTVNLPRSKLARKELHPAVRFVMEAKEEAAQGVNVEVIEYDVWDKYYSMNFAHVDKNAGNKQQSYNDAFAYRK